MEYFREKVAVVTDVMATARRRQETLVPTRRLRLWDFTRHILQMVRRTILRLRSEAAMVIECKIMYAAPFDPQYFKSDAPKRMYANFPAGIHSMYIGEVVNAWKK